MVRARAALVQDGGLLRDPHPRLLRRQRRRRRRLPRADREARLSAVARRRLRLAAADVSVAAARRRLRHRRLLRHPSRLRDGGRLPRVRRPGAPARHPRDRRPGDEPHLVRPSVVPGVAQRPDRAEGRLVRLVGHGRAVSRRADHLRRHRGVQLDPRPGARAVLLAPLLPSPAGPQLREPGRAGGDAGRAALLARPRHRRLPARRRSLSLRGGGDELREPAAHARVSEARARRGGRALSRPRAARRGEPVAGGRRPVLRERRRRRVPHGVPLPRDAAHVHVGAARGRDADLRDPGADPGDSRQLPVGALSPQPRRADAGDGHGRRARLHVRASTRRIRG